MLLARCVNWLAAGGARLQQRMQIPSNALIPLFVGSGVLHFLKPEPFDSIVPPQLPGSARKYTYASGAAELLAAVLLASPVLGPRSNPDHLRRSAAMRRTGGYFSAALLTAVWSANFCMSWKWRKKPWYQQAAGIARLPLQIPLIQAAWRVTQPSRPD